MPELPNCTKAETIAILRAMKVITDSRCTEYSRRGHPERPLRITKTVDRLRSQTELHIDWIDALVPTDAQILRAHSAEHVAFVRNPSHDFDGDTPAYPEIFEHSKRSIGGGLKALELAGKGEIAFSLLRPPGHHATRTEAMGFCFLNSIAITALEAIESGAGKVAVFDFDVHHGNGTEAILLDNPRAAFFSVHQFPAYPGTGQRHIRNCFNYPVLPGASRETYRAALKQAFDDLLKFKPDVIAMSAGFDAFRGDPLSDATLEAEDFLWLGEMVTNANRPSFSVLEGGYSHELPELILSYLKGLAGMPASAASG